MTELIDTLPFDLAGIEPGWVWLTGAGPGDPGLLTLLAYAGLKSADVIVYDALVSESILDIAHPDAERIYAGKRGGKPSLKQPDITAKLVDLAKQGKRVLRLKGGDPFVFGRGGEEALGLVDAEVPFRLVPGVTAGIAGPAYAGIPVTHRDANHAVTFVTGHSAAGDVPDTVQWEAIAKTAPVIVLYMAMRHLGIIAERLMAGGRDPQELVALIAQATTKDQNVVTTTLQQASTTAISSQIKPPALVVIGKTVNLRDQLNWMQHLPGVTNGTKPVGHAHSEKHQG